MRNLVKTSNTNYPFGMLQPGRHNTPSLSYRCGFNGQEMDNEVQGNGNTNTAEFWEYDTRLGRWWSMDPKNNSFESGIT